MTDEMNDDLTNEPQAARCTRCASTVALRAWNELDEEQREVVRRLPASAVYSHAERTARHRWCVRCWHEETRGARREV